LWVSIFCIPNEYDSDGKLFAHLQQLSLSFHTRAKSGELMTKITSDTSALRDVLEASRCPWTFKSYQAFATLARGYEKRSASR
jgi:ABC-type multidrug transport system fused ATPase/permease subunit